MTTIARSTKRHLTRRNQTPKRKPKQKPPSQNGTNAASPADARRDAEWIAPYDSDDPKRGLPELLAAPPTTEIVIHALFTAQHVINELRYHFEMHNLTRGDMELLAQLGKEIGEELEQEE